MQLNNASIYCTMVSLYSTPFMQWGSILMFQYQCIHLPCSVHHILPQSKVKYYCIYLVLGTLGIYQYIPVQTCTYIHTWFTTTLHFESGSIRLATPTSLQSTLVSFIAGSVLPVSSLLDCQTTQAWLASPKLPQPRVDLIDIAAVPSIQRSCIGAPHWEA